MLSSKLISRLRKIGLGADTHATAALEFALLVPVMIVLFFGVYDVSDAMISYEEVFNAARVIAASASNISVQGANSSTQLYYAQIELEASAIFAQMPTVRNGFHHGIRSITVSSVNFEAIASTPACTPGVNCNYSAYVVWSVAYAGPPGGGFTFTPTLRGCATESANANNVETLNIASALTQVQPNGGASGNLADIATANVTTPDPGPAAPDPIIVVDVHYQYTPLFNLFVKNPVDFWASAFWPLRSVQAAVLNGNGTFTKLAADQQYTGLVSTGTGTPVTGPYSISAANVNPPTGPVGTAPAQAEYCISPYYSEPQT